MLKKSIMAAVILLSAVSAFALPDASQQVWYYDSEGNVIGWFVLNCNGQRSRSGSTSDIYEVFTMPCQTLQPIMCSDIGMETIGDCGDSWCYSSGYVMSYNYDIVPDCNGVCLCGEGPACNKTGPTCSVAGKSSRPSSVLRARSEPLPTTMRRGVQLAIKRPRSTTPGISTQLLGAKTKFPHELYTIARPAKQCSAKTF